MFSTNIRTRHGSWGQFATGCNDFCCQKGSEVHQWYIKQDKGLCHTPSKLLPDPSEIFPRRNNARPAVLIIRASLQATISKAQLTRWQIGSPHRYIWRDASITLPFPQLLSWFKVNVIGCAVGEKTDARASSSWLEERASLWRTVVCTLVFRSPHDASAFVLGKGRRSCEFIQRSNSSLTTSFPCKRGEPNSSDSKYLNDVPHYRYLWSKDVLGVLTWIRLLVELVKRFREQFGVTMHE